MGDMIERQSGALTAPERNYFEQYAEAAASNRIIGDLLRFNKGDWLAGQDQDELPLGTRLIANVPDLMIGWVKWVDAKPEEQIMGRVADGFRPAKRSELGDHDEDEWERDDQGRPRDPWQLTNYLILKEEKGDQLYTLAGSSKGLLGAIGQVAGTYGKRMRQRPNDIPVIELGNDKYKHKVYSWVKTPVLKVVDWTDRGAFEEALAAEAAEAAEREEAASEDDIPFDDDHSGFPGNDAIEKTRKTGGKPKTAAGQQSQF